MPKKVYKYVWEKCPHCDEEVRLLPVPCAPQKCPRCGRWIRACSMCDQDTCDCDACDKVFEHMNDVDFDMKKVVKSVVNGQTITYETGHTKEEWDKAYGNESDCLWDILASELLDGSVEVNEDIVYWAIDDRFYETDVSSK